MQPKRGVGATTPQGAGGADSTRAPSSAASVDSLRATLRIAQLDADDDTNPTWDEFEQALATVDALAPRETRQDILTARDALRRIQTGRVWFEPHSDCLDPIIEAIKALDRLAGYDNVSEALRES